jgi:hypothetical protein
MQLFTFVAIFMIFIVLFYLKILRPWQLRWGATDDKVNCDMSGDDIVQKPNFVATRAVSIKAHLLKYGNGSSKLARGELVFIVSISSTMPTC